MQLALDLPGLTRFPIPGFDGYTIDRNGNIYGKRNQQPLATFTVGGYRKLILNSTPCYIHILVLTTFTGTRPPGREARHKNGDRTDNRADNLCWGTKKQNAGDRKRHSGYKCTRIPTEQIERGRRLYEMGISRETIAKAVGCDVRTIRRYIKKENWERNIGQNPRVGRPNHRLQQAAAG